MDAVVAPDDSDLLGRMRRLEQLVSNLSGIQDDPLFWMMMAPAPLAPVALFQSIVTAGSQATIDFSGIPPRFSRLKLQLVSRDTIAGAAFSQVRVVFNNDTTAGNYTNTIRVGSQNSVVFSTNVVATAGGALVGYQPNDGHTANVFGDIDMEINRYASAFHKRVFSNAYEDDAAGLITAIQHARWASTAAINQITITTDGTAFKDGSIADLYLG